jgi:hypothetical protein
VDGANTILGHALDWRHGTGRLDAGARATNRTRARECTAEGSVGAATCEAYTSQR